VARFAHRPVAIKLVNSLQRPGDNVTGATTPDRRTQQIVRAQGNVPHLARVAILSETGFPGAHDSGMIPIESDYFSAARSLGAEPQCVRMRGPAPDLDSALAAAAKESAEALILLEVPLAFRVGKLIAQLAIARRLPTLFPSSVTNA
jgi:putative ABC transport system substrate-binding protein